VIGEFKIGKNLFTSKIIYIYLHLLIFKFCYTVHT